MCWPLLPAERQGNSGFKPAFYLGKRCCCFQATKTGLGSWWGECRVSLGWGWAGVAQDSSSLKFQGPKSCRLHLLLWHLYDYVHGFMFYGQNLGHCLWLYIHGFMFIGLSLKMYVLIAKLRTFVSWLIVWNILHLSHFTLTPAFPKRLLLLVFMWSLLHGNC